MKGSGRRHFRDYGIAIVAAVAVALFIRILVLEAFRIPTPAMRPTLEPGDTIFVAKRPLGFKREARRGDVVVFESPLDPGRDYIKRVLAVAGDTVEVRKGRVTLNGKPLLEDAGGRGKSAPCAREKLPEGTVHEVCWEQPLNEDFASQKVPEGSLFVLGDFRSQGPADVKKRRSWGIIPASSVKGKAEWIWLSIEPRGPGASLVSFPKFRFERMFRRIN